MGPDASRFADFTTGASFCPYIFKISNKKRRFLKKWRDYYHGMFLVPAAEVVPAAEAVAATIATKIEEKNERDALTAAAGKTPPEASERLPFSRKLKWLTHLLWGGSALLAFEHVWHGEVVPWFPFLTAAGNPADAAEMLHEMGTAGVGMAVLVTAVWLVMLGVSKGIEKRPALPQPDAK